MIAGGSRVVTGRVAHKGVSDELKGSLYAIIETPTGQAYHVPLNVPSAENIRPGDLVSVATRPEKAVRAIDRYIANVARGQGGVYALDDGRVDAGGAACRRRLRHLERLGLATPDAANRWTLAPNLLDELEGRDRVSPRKHRLLVRKEPLSLSEQIRYRGPTWLDRVDSATLAPYGFGAELRAAVRERGDVLRQLGMAPDGPGRLSALLELERRALGEQVAGSSGVAFIARTPEGFRGRLQIRAAPGGASYTVVTDASRLVVFRSTSGMRILQGKSVVISHDSGSAMAVRQDRERGLGG
jgi:hypothetical protein